MQEEDIPEYIHRDRDRSKSPPQLPHAVRPADLHFLIPGNRVFRLELGLDAGRYLCEDQGRRLRRQYRFEDPGLGEDLCGRVF